MLLFWLLWHAFKKTLHLLFLGLVWYGLGFLCGANSRRWRRVHSRTSHGPKHSRGTNKSSNPNWNENTHTFVKCITPLVKNTLHSEVIGKWFYRFFYQQSLPRFGQKHVWVGKDSQKKQKVRTVVMSRRNPFLPIPTPCGTFFAFIFFLLKMDLS